MRVMLNQTFFLNKIYSYFTQKIYHCTIFSNPDCLAKGTEYREEKIDYSSLARTYKYQYYYYACAVLSICHQRLSELPELNLGPCTYGRRVNLKSITQIHTTSASLQLNSSIANTYSDGSQGDGQILGENYFPYVCLLYTSPSPRDRQKSRMPSSA